MFRKGKMTRILALATTLAMLMVLMANSAFAYDEMKKVESEVTLANDSNVSFDDLPEEIQAMVHEGDCVIYDESEVTVTADGDEIQGHYYIFPADASYEAAEARSTNVGARSITSQPNGGTYTFPNPVISSSGTTKTYLLSVSYIPVKTVAAYLMDNRGILEKVRDFIVNGLTDKAIAEFTAAIGAPALGATLVAAVQLNRWSIHYATYAPMKKAYTDHCSNKSTGGIIATTKCTYSSGNGTYNMVTVCTNWSGTNVNNTHYGMTANNWRAGVYYAGAERLN